MAIRLGSGDALLADDVRNDFLQGVKLAVDEADGSLQSRGNPAARSLETLIFLNGLSQAQDVLFLASRVA